MSDSRLYPLNRYPDNDEVDSLICIAEDRVPVWRYFWVNVK